MEINYRHVLDSSTHFLSRSHVYKNIIFNIFELSKLSKEKNKHIEKFKNFRLYLFELIKKHDALFFTNFPPKFRYIIYKTTGENPLTFMKKCNSIVVTKSFLNNNKDEEYKIFLENENIKLKNILNNIKLQLEKI